MARNEIWNIDNIDDNVDGQHKNSTGTTIGTKRGQDVTIVGGGGLMTNLAGESFLWDIIVNTSGTDSDTYVYYTGGTGGTALLQIAVTYTGTDKATISSVVKSNP